MYIYDFTTQLSTMASCSATLIAIIGGLVANKVISLSAEKQSAQNRITQIDEEFKRCDEKISELTEWIDYYDAEEYIDDNLDDLLELKELSEVYVDTPDNSMSYDEMLPYWNKALELVKLLENALFNEENFWDNLDTNGVPKSIIDKTDKFQYRICSNYHISNFCGKLKLHKPTITPSQSVELYNQNVSELEKLVEKKSILLTEEIILTPKAEMTVDTSTKRGVLIFGITSLLNVILPIIFMLFNPTTSICWYNTERTVSIILFIIGIITMCGYIYSLFPKKEVKEQEGE